MTELHLQLEEKLREYETIRKVCEHTVQLQQRLEREQAALVDMDQTLDKEQRDVETLEREGLTN